MSDFKAKMHQIRFPLQDPAGGACSALPGSLAVFNGPTSKGRGEEGGEGKDKGRGEKTHGGLPDQCQTVSYEPETPPSAVY